MTGKARMPRTPRGMRDRREEISTVANADAAEAMGLPWLDWYAIQTAPQAEWRVQAILYQQDVPVFLAWKSRWGKENRYVRAKRRLRWPIMPRLLWVGMEQGRERFRDVLGTQSVTGIIGIGEAPRALLGEDVQKFLKRIGSEVEAPEWQKHMRPQREFRVGDKVRIIEGALAGHIVDVTQIRGPKALALAKIMGSEHELHLRTENLEPVV